CQPYTYGVNCSGRCGSCLANAACDRDTGHCHSCKDNFVMPYCTACDPGYHGTNCSEKCGRCASSQPCDPHTGHCLACSNNVAMPLCKGRVGPGVDGVINCGSCRDGAPCRHDNGFCEECEEGYDGYLCQRASGSAVYGPAQVGAIAGSVVTVGLVVALAVLAGAWWIRRKRDKQQGNRSDNIGPNARLTRHDNESARNARREDIKFDDLGKRTENSKGQKPIREMEYLY
ncbi:hypothetical protein BaRGS_00034972, partial [Batillaria attramentaria]